ncbi:MFS transporter [Streptomyces sp. NPDC085614]|uniref:MFS transporter n=1 Tax=unclassified Streptomyces TaxID=2593676 RepID=UPI00165033FE|nr:MFS transporter [Streptomyces sp. ms191]
MTTTEPIGAAEGGVRTPERHPLRTSRDYRALWAGDLVSQFGSKITEFVLPLLVVTTLEASGVQVGLLQTLYMAPFFLLPLFAGVWLERRAGRPVMIAADLARFVLVLGVPVLALLDILALWHVYVIALVGGALTIVYDIAATSYLPRLLPERQLPAANSLVTVNQALGGTGGPGLAGWLTGLFGPAATLVFDALSYLASASALMLIRHREKTVPRPADRDLRGELAEGLRSVLGSAPIRAVAVHAGIYNAGIALVNLAFLMRFVRELGHGGGDFGVVMVSGGIGAILGALTAPALIRRLGFGRAFLTVLSFSTTAYFLLTAVDGGAGDLLWAALAYFLGTAGASAGSVIAVTMRQRLTPPGVYARMTATYRLITFGMLTLGTTTAGVLTDTVGARITLAGAPVVLLLSVLPICGRSVRTLGRLPDRAAA